jgi:predicted ATP-grasp superfamily ATP-dependent carboligase
VTTRLIVAGVSTRAAAASAAKAGFTVTAIDAFADLDQHPAVHSVSVPYDSSARFSAHAAARAVRDVEADAVAYLSPFENHPGVVTSLTLNRTLWGNPPDVLRRVRDPFLLAGVLRRKGFVTPMTRVDVPRELAASTEWLVKPFRSGGGNDIRRWSADAGVSRDHYAQELVIGVPASIVFVAAGGRAVPLGLSRQLIGDAAFGASAYRYCGNVLASADDDVLTDRVLETATALAQCATEEFGLVGLKGIDCIVRDEVPYTIEVNPRWCSSMELVERHYGVSMCGVHAVACAKGALPDFDLVRARQGRPAMGKAVVFATNEMIAGDTRSWLADETVRDIPKPGERIAAGQPICTVFAEGAGMERCRAQLRVRADSIVTAMDCSSADRSAPRGR